MTLDAEATAWGCGQQGGLPWVRWLGLVGLLAAEVALLTILFDLPYSDASDPSALVLRNLKYVAQGAAAAGVVIVLVGGRSWNAARVRLTWELARLDRRHRVALALACHLVAFGGFAAYSASLFTAQTDVHSIAGVKLAVWGLAGITTFALWAWAALPLAGWLRIIRRGLGVLALAALAALAACRLGGATQKLWLPLSRATFWMVEHLLRLVFNPVVCDPARFLVGTPRFQEVIGPACSGYEGIGLIWVLMLGAFWIFRDRLRFPAALLLLPIATALIWIANAFRIAALVTVGTLLAPEIAIGGFHSYTGWLAFNLLGLGLLTAALHCRFFCHAPAPAVAHTDEPSPGPTAAYLVPLLAIIAAAMVTGAFSPSPSGSGSVDRLYPVRLFVAALAFAWSRRGWEDLRPSWSWEATAIGVAVFVLWLALEAVAPGGSGGAGTGAGQATSPWVVLSPWWASAWLLARVVGSVAFVPVAEELAFRGYLLRRLVAADFRAVTPSRLTWLAVLISSAAFGALHGRWVAGTLAGGFYALALARKGKLGEAVLAHAVTNGLLAAWVLATGQWSLW